MFHLAPASVYKETRFTRSACSTVLLSCFHSARIERYSLWNHRGVGRRSSCFSMMKRGDYVFSSLPSLLSLAKEKAEKTTRTYASTRPQALGDAPLIPSDAAQTIHQEFHTLPDGMRLEVLRCNGTSSSSSSLANASYLPPLVFLHGSYHGAWCYAENFLPYFASAGYDTMAVSFRAQGESDKGNLKVSGDLKSHVADIASFVGTLARPPVLIAHSFGGLVAEAYATYLDSKQPNDGDGVNKGGQKGNNSFKWESNTALPSLSGLALLSSVPPSGNKDIIIRITKKSFMTSMKITMAFVFRAFEKNIDMARETFFSEDIPIEDLKRYHKKLAEASRVRLLDLSELNKILPLPPLSEDFKRVDASGKRALPVFVAGGTTDLVVDSPALEETAFYFDVQPVLVGDMAHDCMLDTRWRSMAAELKKWLDESFGPDA